MKKILHIISSPKEEGSYSIQLGRAIVEKLKTAHPGSVVTETNLVKTPVPHLAQEHLTAFFAAPEARTAAMNDAALYSDESVRNLQEADILVLGAPVYNFNIHSSLKAWLDHIVRAGLTFRYGETGPQGLLTDKKVYIAIASGGIYSEGDLKAIDYVEPYLRTILGFIGLKDVTVFRVEGTAYPELKDAALEKGLSSIQL